MLVNVLQQQTINAMKIEYINKAVNDVGADRKTLRELVEETRLDVEVLKIRTQVRYPITDE